MLRRLNTELFPQKGVRFFTTNRKISRERRKREHPSNCTLSLEKKHAHDKKAKDRGMRSAVDSALLWHTNATILLVH